MDKETKEIAKSDAVKSISQRKVRKKTLIEDFGALAYRLGHSDVVQRCVRILKRK